MCYRRHRHTRYTPTDATHYTVVYIRRIQPHTRDSRESHQTPLTSHLKGDTHDTHTHRDHRDTDADRDAHTTLTLTLVTTHTYIHTPRVTVRGRFRASLGTRHTLARGAAPAAAMPAHRARRRAGAHPGGAAAPAGARDGAGGGCVCDRPRALAPGRAGDTLVP